MCKLTYHILVIMTDTFTENLIVNNEDYVPKKD